MLELEPQEVLAGEHDPDKVLLGALVAELPEPVLLPAAQGLRGAVG